MIIDDRCKFVVQHIPKAGGTFVIECLLRNVSSCGVIRNESRKWYLKPDEVIIHNGITDQTQSLGWLEHVEFRKLDDYFIENYTLWIGIRHPVDLWISHYIDKEHRHLVDPQVENVHNPITFSEHVLQATKGFSPSESFSRKIFNATKLAQGNAGVRVLRQETLRLDLLEAVRATPGLVLTDTLYTNIVTGNVYSRRAQVKEREEFRRLIYKDMVLYDKIRTYELFLTEEFYNTRWKYKAR